MVDRATASNATGRQVRLLERLQLRAYAQTQDLSAFLGVSEATVRRDLIDLEARGLIRRTHGGAMPLAQITKDFSNTERLGRNASEKARIGKAAASLVADGDAVFLDSGTTTLQVAGQLVHRAGLTFVTNGTDVFNCLAGAGAERLYVTGGEYNDVNHGLTGALAVEAIRRFNVDKLFLSVSAVDLRRGQIVISHPALAEVQRAMIEIAQQVIVVADYSKFTRNAMIVIAPLEDVDCVVTDTACHECLGDIPDTLRRKFIFA
ncbi:MAG: DeoR/GlpR family DNA-binding transcription regulator [Paracoccaceae bacterium]